MLILIFEIIPSRQGYGFSNSHVWMWELDNKENLAPKNWCFWTVMLEKTLESPLDCKEIQPVHPKGDQSWVFIGRTDAEAETPILWPLDAKSWLIGKDPDAGKHWRQEEKRMTEDEMVGWKSVLNIHWKDWCWSWNSITLATWCKELTHWKRLWCWKRLKSGGEEDDRRWDGWMASLTW